MTNIRMPSTTRLRWVLGLAATAYFMVVLDSTVVITAAADAARLARWPRVLQWTVNACGIVVAAGIITAAAHGDRFGRRRVFNLGLALFTLSSAACASASSIGELAVARRPRAWRRCGHAAEPDHPHDRVPAIHMHPLRSAPSSPPKHGKE